MKTISIIFILLLLVSCEKEVKSELEINLSSITSSLPRLCGTNPISSSCWAQFYQTSKTYSVAPKYEQEALAYFKNQGYVVSLNSGTLVFDFSDQHKKYLLHKKVLITLEQGILMVLILIPTLFLIRVHYRYKNKVKLIKKIYYQNPEDLFFWDKTYKKDFESALSKTSLPLYWTVNLSENKDKIVSITYYNGRSMGRIASHNDFFKNMFPNVKLS